MSEFPNDAEHEAIWRYVSANSCDFMGAVKAVENIEADLAPLVAAREAQAAAKALADRSARVKAADELATQSPNLTPKAALDLLGLVAGPIPADALRSRLLGLSWEMCPQDGKRLRDELGEGR